MRTTQQEQSPQPHADIPLNALHSLILLNAASTAKGKQGDNSEDLRTQHTIQTLFRHLGLLSPKDGKSVLAFAARPVRMERERTPMKARGREKGILIQLTGEKDVRKLLRAWGKLPKYTEHRTLIRYPIETAGTEEHAEEEGELKVSGLAGEVDKLQLQRDAAEAKTSAEDEQLDNTGEDSEDEDEMEDDGLEDDEDANDSQGQPKPKVRLQRHSKKILRKK